MRVVPRIWTGCAALGAGLLHLGLISGAPVPLAVATAAIGLAEVGWGIATFARTAPPAPRAALVGALLPGLSWLALLLVGVSSAALPAYPLATATAFELAIATVLAVRLRRRSAPDSAHEGRPVRLLVGVAIGATLLALVTTPALAATGAGAAAPRHAHFDVGPSHEH